MKHVVGLIYALDSNDPVATLASAAVLLKAAEAAGHTIGSVGSYFYESKPGTAVGFIVEAPDRLSAVAAVARVIGATPWYIAAIETVEEYPDAL